MEIDIYKVLDYLRDSSDEYANAKANRIMLEQKIKAVKAAVMKMHESLPVSAQEREAYSSIEYNEIVDDLREAVYKETLIYSMREAASLKASIWQTNQADIRAEKRVI